MQEVHLQLQAELQSRDRSMSEIRKEGKNRMIHRLCTEVADDYGVIAGIIFYHIGYWVEKNRKEGHNLHACRYWMYTTVKEMAEKTFYYLTENQIRYALSKLREGGVIETGNYNKTTYDRTIWYTLTEKEQYIWESCKKEPETI